MSKLDDFSEDFADAVRKAFVDIYGGAPSQRAMSAIMPSWSERAVHLGWVEPDPRVVLVLTEHGWVADPFRSKDDMDMWARAATSLKRVWGNVSFDSVNHGVQIMFIDLPEQIIKVLASRTAGMAYEKSDP